MTASQVLVAYGGSKTRLSAHGEGASDPLVSQGILARTVWTPQFPRSRCLAEFRTSGPLHLETI